MEPVMQGLDLQLQEPFLLYRNWKCNIHGVWFYDKEDCVRIATMLHKLVKELEDDRKSTSKSLMKCKKNLGPDMSNVDIYSMLSKAQEDFNISKASDRGGGTTAESKPLVNTILGDSTSSPLNAPLGPDVTSQSVMDFFAKAKVNPVHFKPGDQPAPGNAVTLPETKPLLARLMSHPAAHTLEHIEKQQRSTTPQPVPPSQVQAPQPTPLGTMNNVGSASNRSKRRTRAPSQSETVGTNALLRELPAHFMNQSVTQSASDSNGSTSFLRILTPTTNVGTTMTNHQTSGLSSTNSGNPFATLFAHATIPTSSDDVVGSSLSGSGSAPALMPPVMFSAPSPQEPPARPLEPLTRNQLLQAFNYLLTSDPDFVNKLHEAYVKSFGEILS
ncbi:mRNA-decapping enzyme 1A isoform X2 [Orussus abietinus]|nr:mRNA-decapping enzyme 1A isoform X2 [Orussus abietinus]